MSKSSREPFRLVTEHTRVLIWADAVFTLVMRRFEWAHGWLCSLVMWQFVSSGWWNCLQRAGWRIWYSKHTCSRINTHSRHLCTHTNTYTHTHTPPPHTHTLSALWNVSLLIASLPAISSKSAPYFWHVWRRLSIQQTSSSLLFAIWLILPRLFLSLSPL